MHSHAVSAIPEGIGADRELDQCMGRGQNTEVVTVRHPDQVFEGVALAAPARGDEHAFRQRQPGKCAPVRRAEVEFAKLVRSRRGGSVGRGRSARRVRRVLADPFRADALASGGLDDRRSRNGYLSRAEQLVADAVGAGQAFFSTCGSSLSVKAAMMAVAGNDPGGLLVSRDSHRSIVAGVIGTHLSQCGPADDDQPERDVVCGHGRVAAADGRRGTDLLGSALSLARHTRERIADIDGPTVLDDRLLGEQASHDLDRMQILIDVSELGVSGFSAPTGCGSTATSTSACTITAAIMATMSMADDEDTTGRLATAGRVLRPGGDGRRGPCRRTYRCRTTQVGLDLGFGP
jgi:hypothetical protein